LCNRCLLSVCGFLCVFVQPLIVNLNSGIAFFSSSYIQLFSTQQQERKAAKVHFLITRQKSLKETP
jgi:hypothetical protein